MICLIVVGLGRWEGGLSIPALHGGPCWFRRRCERLVVPAFCGRALSSFCATARRLEVRGLAFDGCLALRRLTLGAGRWGSELFASCDSLSCVEATGVGSVKEHALLGSRVSRIVGVEWPTRLSHVFDIVSAPKVRRVAQVWGEAVAEVLEPGMMSGC